ncbi:anti-phage dCTP deaminase [Fluviicola taffensis]|uniref:anti-phage dCTP deaminase n=1 Tax=Fluviicola taffensis TaxID=191579 RepID=UPI00313773A1
MTEPAQQLKLVEVEDAKKDTRKLKQRINDTHTEELVIGLCGPIGTDISFVSDRLIEILESKYGYQCRRIKLSDLIIRHSNNSLKLEKIKGFERYNNLIDEGNALREKYDNSVLAELAINEIAVNREELKQTDTEFESNRICYIIDSIKNKEELNLFRLIYRDIFYFFGVYSPTDVRVKILKDKGLKEEEIYRLIDRDSGEETHHGQMVTDTFVNSDFFLRIEDNSPNVIDPKIKRFLNLLFNNEIVTPTANETAMYLASSAAGNSACLSRQVGACITDEKGEILSIGWNDVPKVNGGVYQTDMNNVSSDKRCMHKGAGLCFNDKEKEIIRDLLVNSLISRGLVLSARRDELDELIKNSRIKELIEFSRAVHAEMLAIISGSQKSGTQMIGGKLFCTTYPCHNCARHIIAAGIKEVYYIEPYRKSLAIKLHDDALTENESDTTLVRVLMYDGVSPRRYLDFFKMDGYKRKHNGVKISIPPKEVKPKNTLSLRAIPFLESQVTQELKNKELISLT